MFFKKLLYDPITHLVMIGGLLFLLHDLLQPTTLETTHASFPLTPATVKQSVERHFSNQKSSPQPSEIETYVTQLIKNELLFQEAIALKMHHSAWAKDRLIQQMTRYYEGQFIPSEPTEQTLRTFYDQNSEKYLISDRLSFQQIVINAEHIPEIQSLLANLSDQDQAEFLRQIEPFKANSLLSEEFRDTHRASLEELLGSAFVENLLEAPLQVWSGPIFSDRGAHLIKLNAVKLGHAEQYDGIKDRIKDDWIRASRAGWVSNQIQLLWSKYNIQLSAYLPP